MRYALWLLASVVVWSSAEAARVTFKKTVPAGQRIDAPSDRIALIQMDGETSECSHVFLRIEFMEAIKATGAEISDVSHLKTPIAERRKSVDADLYIESVSCKCRAAGYPLGDGSGMSWYAGACQASFRVSDPDDRQLAIVTVKGQSEEKTDFLDFSAFLTSGKRMMVELAKMLRPHERTLVIETDRNVPGEKQAARLLRKNDYAGARAVWERELEAHPEHAGLHFSLAAVADAIGDVDSARRHYEEAVRLAPDEEKYARFKGYFERRTP